MSRSAASSRSHGEAKGVRNGSGQFKVETVSDNFAFAPLPLTARCQSTACAGFVLAFWSADVCRFGKEFWVVVDLFPRSARTVDAERWAAGTNQSESKLTPAGC